MSVSGAPRKIEGRKSKKVCVIAMLAIKTTRTIAGIDSSNAVEIARRRTAIRFICMPGIRPVIVPAKRPMNKARMIWESMLYYVV